MTKNEIIRELRRCNPQNIQYLSVAYHNRKTDTTYVFAYQYSVSTSSESRRELFRVLASLYKLRSYVDSIDVVYFPIGDDDVLHRFYDSCNDYVYSISDFIKTIKK